MNIGFTAAGLLLTGPEKERALPERRQNVISRHAFFSSTSWFSFDFGKTKKELVLESDCTTPEIHHTVCKIGHWTHQTSIVLDFYNQTMWIVNGWCSQCPILLMVWWMSGVVDFLIYTKCGECLVPLMSGLMDVWCGQCPILHTMWWMLYKPGVG